MFKPLRMNWVTVYLLRDDVRQVSLLLARFGNFQPERLAQAEKALPESPGIHYRELATSARTRLDKITNDIGNKPTAVPAVNIASIPTEDELVRLDRWLGERWRTCSMRQEEERHLEEQSKHIDRLTQTLEQFKTLDMDLSLLQKSDKLLDLRLLVLPQKNLQRLQEALSLAAYRLHPFLTHDETTHVLLAGLPQPGREIEMLLEVAGCRPIEIPPEFRDHPHQVRSELKKRLETIITARAGLRQQMHDFTRTNAQQLQQAAAQLRLAFAYAGLTPALHARGNLCVVAGWVPCRDLPALKNLLQKRLAQRFALNVREPHADEHLRVPSLTQHPKWLQPFASLVANYGTPRYTELDPTLLFALTFVAMFGMMFGDIGHGGIIALFGLAAWRRLSGYGSFVLTLGLSSMGFGLLYGSLFGYETIIHPVWMSPFSDPALMLLLAIYWGIGYILLASALNIRNLLVERRFKEALWGSRGLAGVALYLGVMYGASRWLADGGIDGICMGVILVSLSAMLHYHWRRLQASTGEKVLVVVIEAFETLMSYIANTLSFLRVAAFSLNHVVLAVAVFALAGMLDGAGHWIAVVLGNGFILILEGAIVAIQVLRLEYYEGFSRYFSGEGRRFEPLRLEKI